MVSTLIADGYIEPKTSSFHHPFGWQSSLTFDFEKHLKAGICINRIVVTADRIGHVHHHHYRRLIG
jgi:hypothetical protein